MTAYLLNGSGGRARAARWALDNAVKPLRLVVSGTGAGVAQDSAWLSRCRRVSSSAAGVAAASAPEPRVSLSRVPGPRVGRLSLPGMASAAVLSADTHAPSPHAPLPRISCASSLASASAVSCGETPDRAQARRTVGRLSLPLDLPPSSLFRLNAVHVATAVVGAVAAATTILSPLTTAFAMCLLAAFWLFVAAFRHWWVDARSAALRWAAALASSIAQRLALAASTRLASLPS